MLVDMLPENIIRLREEAGYSRYFVAEKLGCKYDIVAKWEQGQRIPSPEHIYALSDLYNVEFIFRSTVRHPIYQASPGERK